MSRAMRRGAPCFVPVLAAVVWAAGCTLDITRPVEPPPADWDPALNTHPNGAEFQELLDRYVREGLPGVGFLVRTPQGLWNGSAGYARVESSDPMLPTHRHHAASVTKIYTAAAVLLMAEDGLIDLDARISRYLPDTIYRPIPNGAQATVRHLLGHRSGIPDFSGDIAYDLDFLNDPMGSYPPERLLSYLHGQPSMAEPGGGYFYSNANFFLLALIMDYATQGSHADFMNLRILEPLGLTETYYEAGPGHPVPPGLVNSYQDLAGDGRLMNVTDLAINSMEIFFGNAGLVATSADYAHFLESLLGGELIGQEMLGQMLERPEGSRYGLGLGFRETPFGWAVGHGGGDLGVLSQVRRFPDHDATLVLLTNGGDGGVPAGLFDRLWDDAMEVALGGL